MGDTKISRLVYLELEDDEKVRKLAEKETDGEISGMLRKLVKEALEMRKNP